MPNEKNSFSEVGEDEQNNQGGEPIVSHEEIQDDFDNPLGAPVIEKNYTRPNVNVTAEQLHSHIAEPPINAEMIDLTKPKPSAAPPPQPEPQKEQQPFNPQMNQMRSKDKRDAAERAVDAVLDGYAFLKSKANYFLKINDGQLKRLEKQGKVNLNIPVPFDEHGNTITLEEYIKEFNRQNEDSMVFEQEDRDAIRPVMIRYFEDQGIGMSTRDELIYLGIKELITFGAQIWQGLAIKKEMVKGIIELTQSYNNSQPPPMYSTPPPPPPPPPPPAPTAYNSPDGNQGGPGGDQQEFEHIVEHEEIQQVEIPLAARGANAAALEMTGAMQPNPQVTKKRRAGRPPKATTEKLKQERLGNGEQQ